MAVSKTQTQAIFDDLRAGMPKCKGITSMQAIEKYGATRLSGIIFEIRKKLEGTEYDIIDVWHTGTNRFGGTTRFVEYVMVRR